ncbi:hypothetical protein [Gordonia malaquae]|uniref:hypothetical protein n=1 Tax=Gordonia malaquae TaxID=410332 RepID=UPI0030FE491D
MVRLRGKVAITTMAGIVAAGVPAQALAATMPSIDSGVAVDGPTIGDHHDVLGTWVPSDLLGDAFVVVTPGTDDDGVFPPEQRPGRRPAEQDRSVPAVVWAVHRR